MKRFFHRLYEYVALYLGLGFLGVMCLAWVPFAMVLYPLLPKSVRGRFGRFMIMSGFRAYIRWLSLLGACRFDLTELDQLCSCSPVIIAPNHPCLLDAVMVISRLPNVACIMKAELMNNLFLGAAARLAAYIRNDSPLTMVVNASEALKSGSHLLIFPEGTRTTALPVSPFVASIGLIARRANVPVQTVIIETDSAYLSKGWPLFKRPDMPITYRLRLGKCFEPRENTRELMAELERYFADQFAQRAPMPESPPYVTYAQRSS